MIYDRAEISTVAVRELYKSKELLADCLTGHGRKEKGTGLRKNLLSYIDEQMKEEYPEKACGDWTKKDVRDIREKILKKARDDAGHQDHATEPPELGKE